MTLVGGILYQVAVVRTAPVQLGMLVEKSVLKRVEAAQFLVACSMEKGEGLGTRMGWSYNMGMHRPAPTYCTVNIDFSKYA